MPACSCVCVCVCVCVRGRAHVFSVVFFVPEYLNTLHFYSSGGNTDTRFMILG
jgi:hypothetical protein